jgi:serine/threonine protein kinase
MNLAHRDIKPHNIMLDVDGFVKLSTFLFSRWSDPSRLLRLGDFASSS